MQFDKVDPATCKCVSYCPQATPPRTNADRIRSMSDEELAKWICDILDDDCFKEWVNWLQQGIRGNE